jgi:hypothetical protein
LCDTSRVTAIAMIACGCLDGELEWVAELRIVPTRDVVRQISWEGRNVTALAMRTTTESSRVIAGRIDPCRTKIASVGHATGTLIEDGSSWRMRLTSVGILGRDCGNTSVTTIDDERVLLEEFTQHLGQLDRPLIVTCGGRSGLLPLVRYRCLAHRMRAPILTTSISNRLVYFDRWDNNWHVDISDHLATHGATHPLTLEELCSLCGVENRTPTTAVAPQRAALAIFELFGRLITLSKWCRRYHDGGIDGLKKRRRGPKDRRTRFYDEIAKRAIATHIVDLQREKLTAYEFFVTEAQAARDNENVKLAERGHKLLPKVPSYSWFLIRCDEEEARKKDEGAKGRRKVRQDYDVSISGPKVRKLLERVEIDGKSVRVALREEPEKAKKFRRSDLLILGPFTLIAAVDCRSALPLGLCFTYDGEDIHSVLACFRHTMRPKAYLHDPEQASWWGCKHYWPARGRLSLVVYDRLKSGYSNSVRYALRRAGITIQRPPPYTPPGKSKVERFFQEFERFCKDYPGYMPDPEKWISEADPIANALFTPKEFIRDVHQWIVDEYSQKPQQELGNRSPYEVWKELSQLQRIRPYPNPKELDYLFSDHKRCTLNKDGIHLNNLEYNSKKLQPIIDQHGPGCRVQVAFDKHDLGEVTVFDPATGKAYSDCGAETPGRVLEVDHRSDR